VSLHTGKVERPRCDVRQPQRSATRTLINGVKILPSDELAARIPWAKLITGAVWVVCSIYAASLWITA
jgi:hypothetical protein